MRKQMIENAAFEVATQVRAVEDVIDSALAEIAELQSKMLRARTVTGTGVATGQPALEQLAEAVSALIAARGGMARCHAELVEAKKHVPGLRTVGFGDNECPPAEGANHLRVVA
ncbi:MAG TPA: hypothetical protein VFK58_07360 [Sphingomicrobium sp.]|nr:hypothetical protein [Sphingomicrobium sp.]